MAKRPFPHFKFPDEIELTYSKMPDYECKWHQVPVGSWKISCINYGWFPTECIMGVGPDKRYTDSWGIGAKIGANMGSRSIAVTEIDQAIKMLTESGYTKITHSEIVD